MVAGLTCIGIVGIQDPVRPEVRLWTEIENRQPNDPTNM